MQKLWHFIKRLIGDTYALLKPVSSSLNHIKVMVELSKKLTGFFEL